MLEAAGPMIDTAVGEETVLSVDGLTKHFPVTKGLILMKTVGLVRAVENVSFSIKRGKTLALVGNRAAARRQPPR